MANIRVTCPACKSELEIDSAFEGQEVECGNCLEVFKATRPGSAGSSGTGKIPGADRSSGGSGRSRPADRPAPKKRRRDDDDDYEHDRRRRRADDDDDFDDYDPRPYRRAGEGDGAATASLVLGILAVFPGCCCGVLGAPIGLSAVVTGIIGLKSQNNKTMAIVGLVLGALSLCLAVVGFLAGMGNAMFNPNRMN
jgi:predicted Zn finger-like uncharacterized protein